jgi:hypothetical protein
MSQGNLGAAELIASLNLAGFEKDLKRLESDTAATFKRLSAASQGIFPKGVFSAGTADAKALQAALSGVGTGAG